MLRPDAELLKTCPDDLPDAESGNIHDLIKNRRESKKLYKDCARRHNALVELPLQVSE